MFEFVQLGFVVDYISHPVINSFTTAAAITIACSQIKVSDDVIYSEHHSLTVHSCERPYERPTRDRAIIYI